MADWMNRLTFFLPGATFSIQFIVGCSSWHDRWEARAKRRAMSKVMLCFNCAHGEINRLFQMCLWSKEHFRIDDMKFRFQSTIVVKYAICSIGDQFLLRWKRGRHIITPTRLKILLGLWKYLQKVLLWLFQNIIRYVAIFWKIRHIALWLNVNT